MILDSKPSNGTLYIGEKTITIDTEINYNLIELTFIGNMNVVSLLPDNYIVKKGFNKLVIVKMDNDKKIINDLLTYKGSAIIQSCKITSLNFVRYNINIEKTALQLWSTLRGLIKSGDDVAKDWAAITDNWQDIKFEGKNNKYSYIKLTRNTDKEAKNIIRRKEVREK